MAVFPVKFDGGPLGTTTIDENLKLVTNLAFLSGQFFLSIGQRKHGETITPDWNICGAKGVARLEVHSYQKKDGTGLAYINRVAEWLEPGTPVNHPDTPWVRPDDGTATPAAPASASAAAPAGKPF